MIKPRTLRPGNRVAAISLSRGWPSVFPRAYQDGKRQFQEAFGIEVVESRHALADIDWLATHPEARAADLMEVLQDPTIQGIVSTIGGDDSIRMLPFLDYSVIRGNPKIFLGYSDSTVTHFAFMKAGVISFYGPSLMAGFDENGGLTPYMVESVRQVLFTPSPSVLISPNSDGWTIESWEWANEERNATRRELRPCSGWKWLQGRGQHRGRLIGGCLDVMDWVRGTMVWPSPAQWRNSILFMETSEDQPSPKSVTYMLRSLAATGALSEVGAILYGRPYGEETSFQAYDEALLGVLAELGLTSLPVITRMDFGHTDPKFTLPIGVAAEIDCDVRQIRLLESPTVW
ncbi:MAG: LD-carboxypeptidase [Acidobacteriaceae bacterium]|nr:LD-carboxypeptidase [Acidobacteriaceae bacterium]